MRSWGKTFPDRGGGHSTHSELLGAIEEFTTRDVAVDVEIEEL